MSLSLEELRRYDWCQFYDCGSNVKDKKTGARVGNYMAVSGYGDRWKIYNIYGGMPIIDVWITSLEDAVKIAKIIEKIYGDYLAIYEIWERVDVSMIARLSVDGGEAVYNTITELNQRKANINYNDFHQLLMEKMK